MKHYFELVWVIFGKWGWMEHYFGWVGVYGALFWVGGGGQENILDGLRWVGGEWGWVHCLIMPF